MDPKTALIITIALSVLVLCGIVFLSVRCVKATQKLKAHGEKLFLQKRK